jgi:hypothetical protein
VYDEHLFDIAVKTNHAIGQCFTLKDKDNIFHLDIFLSSDADFAGIKKDTELLTFENSKIKAASIRAIKNMKERFGRETDKADVELINKRLGGK